MTPFVFVKRLDKDLPMPCYATDGAAGIDLYSNVYGSVSPGGSVVVPTGVAMAIQRGFKGVIEGRSGLGFKHDIVPFHGIIDSDFCGEIKVKLFNFGTDIYDFKRGDRICQICIEEARVANLIERDELVETKRGENGFGHTGK